MRTIKMLTLRHLRCFFRDRLAVFFSFLSVFIIIGLYVLFLGKLQVDSLKMAVGEMEGIRYLVDSWIMAGILTVNAVTVSLSAYGIMINDGERGALKEFLTAPIKRSHLITSYILSTVTIGLIISFTTFILAEIYIVSTGGEFIGLLGTLKVLGLLFIIVLSSAALTCFLASLVNSINAFSTMSTLIGTLIGFLAGVYIPIGVLPESVQLFVKFIPFTYAASSLRQVFMEDPLAEVFEGAPAEALQSYEEAYGVVINFGNYEVSQPVMVGILLLTTAIFFILAVYRLSKYRIKI